MGDNYISRIAIDYVRGVSTDRTSACLTRPDRSISLYSTLARLMCRRQTDISEACAYIIHRTVDIKLRTAKYCVTRSLFTAAAVQVIAR